MTGVQTCALPIWGELKIREEEENDSREEMGEKLEGDRGKLTKSRERLS